MPATNVSPAEALESLLEGNRRFADGNRRYPNQEPDHRAALARGQSPFAVLFGCSDSRVPPETVFDRGLGDLFVARTAGHVAGPEVLGSIEYGVRMLGAPLVVVLGHESCGAVTAARQTVVDGVTPPGFVRDVVERVAPSVLAGGAAADTGITELVDEHVRHTVDLLTDRSAFLATEAAEGRCGVAGLTYSLSEGTVRVVSVRGPLEGAAEKTG